MKVSDLMLNDLFTDKNGSVLLIDGIGCSDNNDTNDRYCGVFDKIENRRYNIHLDEIEPIHITYDILEDNGFELLPTKLGTFGEDSAYRYENNDKQFIIELELDTIEIENRNHFNNKTTYKDVYWVNIVHGCSIVKYKMIEYVHELQQLLRLFGMKELANNFKLIYE